MTHRIALRCRTLSAALLAALTLVPAMTAHAGPRILRFEKGDALKCYEATREATSKASDIRRCTLALEETWMNDEKRSATLVNRATLKRRLGQVSAAVEDCERAIGIGLSGPEAGVSCAAVFIEAGHPQAAIDVLEATGGPEGGERYKYTHNLALAHHNLGEYSQAYAWIEDTIALKPGFAPAMELKSLYTVIGDTTE
ncbi:tetratricopeptide repeat protein [Henriciella aquimarina]|uniref:tetratricopeptide repeat protein n=1 Tax=Henriciella aquimarina TaxID=545261 RepID=UPI0009FED05D|nr:hypothetical protein [Henriciella aquimarina]